MINNITCNLNIGYLKFNQGIMQCDKKRNQ
jgi:hypothetical protein